MSRKHLSNSDSTDQPKYDYQKPQYGFAMVSGSDTRARAEESPKVDDSTRDRDSKKTDNRK